jgi:hypothetical protein
MFYYQRSKQTKTRATFIFHSWLRFTMAKGSDDCPTARQLDMYEMQQEAGWF